MGVFEDLDRTEIESAAERLPWPDASTDLRALGKGRQQHALIAWQRGRPEGHIHGYREGAVALVERIAENPHEIDDLVYPFLLCWRHHIELVLKDLLNSLSYLNEKPRKDWITHKINVLWQEARPLIVALPGSDGNLVHVDRILHQLVEMDPDGQEFRYHVRKYGTPTLPRIDRLDVANFHEAMLGVSDYLIGVSTATEEAISAKAEMIEHWGYA